MKLIEILLSILITISLSLSGFTLGWIFKTNATVAVMQQNLIALQQTTSQKAIDDKQDASIRKHWKLHGWARGEINKLHFKDGNPPETWPDLGN